MIFGQIFGQTSGIKLSSRPELIDRLELKSPQYLRYLRSFELKVTSWIRKRFWMMIFPILTSETDIKVIILRSSGSQILRSSGILESDLWDSRCQQCLTFFINLCISINVLLVIGSILIMHSSIVSPKITIWSQFDQKMINRENYSSCDIFKQIVTFES
jgi:hypothetical protein